MSKNRNYWQDRFKLIEDDAYKKSLKFAKEIDYNFRYTLSKIEKDIAIWYQRFADNNVVSNAEARKLIQSRELEELQWNVEEYIKKGKDNAITHMWEAELENSSAKFHINRLEALKLQVQQCCKNMFENITDDFDNFLRDIYTDSYYRSAYEVQKGFNTYWGISKIDNDMLNMIINKPWADDGSNFSERIWGKYRPILVNKLHRELTDCVIRGDNPNNLTDRFAKEFKTSQSVANRLVMSEYAYFNSLSIENSLNDLGVEEFEVVETLDSTTCKKCQEMDGKHYPIYQYEIGVTAPPFHPHCRGTTCPYFNDEFTEGEMRAARNEKGVTYYTDCKNYKEWKEKYVVNSVENGIIKTNNVESENIEVHIIGKIDKNIYKCITDDIVTDDVIITDERIQHIMDRHPNDYEKYYNYIREVIENPDYIINGNKPNSALILKEFFNGEERFKTILRLITSSDDASFKNSIITFMKINNKEWERLLRNKVILYKKE